ncbi:MAG: endonuclease [Rubrivivax sp.]|nr:MAG: endonuclease [Rubrivivax sp.]
MPEGPSIVILREAIEAAGLPGQTVETANGNASIDHARLAHRRLKAVRSWGKHTLLEFDDDLTVRIHLLMFGSYRINELKPDAAPRLALEFEGGDQLNFYTCSVQFIEQPLEQVYDWRADVMSDQWDAVLARKKLRAQPDTLACDAILDQTVFAGAGNIFKNEVLFRIRVHPLSTIGALPAAKLRELVDETQRYGGQFLAWKKAGVLKQNWLAHTKRTCPRCLIPFTKAKLGKGERRSFFCESCQRRYGAPGSGEGQGVRRARQDPELPMA